MNDPSPGDRQPDAGGAVSPFDAQPAREQAGAAVAAVKDAASDVAATASDHASSIIGQVKDQASAAVSGHKDGLADRIDELADAVHKSGAQFDGKQDWIAGAIERGASELGALASALRENDLGNLLGRVQTIARQQPALFIGAALAAGFALSRLGKIVAADISRDDLPTLPEVGHGNG